MFLEACDVWGLALLYSCMKVRNPTKDSVTSVLQVGPACSAALIECSLGLRLCATGRLLL